MDGGPILLQKPAMSENNITPQTLVQSSPEIEGVQDCPSCSDHLKLIRKQFSRIESLENEISILRCERDALMFENEKLQFEKQVVTEALNSHNRSDQLSTSPPSNNSHVAIISSEMSDPSSGKNAFNNNNSSAITNRSDNLGPQEMVSSNSSFSSTSSTSFATSHNSSASSIESSIAIPPSNASTRTQATAVNGNHTNSPNVVPSGPRGSITTKTSLSVEHFEMIRKRQYRVGLNLFNKSPPERGIQFLVQNNFIDVNGPHQRSKSSKISLNNNRTSSSSLIKDSLVDVDETIESLAIGVAHFLITRKGLSKQSIGDYIGNLQNPFNQRVLYHFVNEIDLIGLPVDVALRKFQTYFRFPGEAQKIDKILEVFSHRFLECNSCLPKSVIMTGNVRLGGQGAISGDQVNRGQNNNNHQRIVQRRSTHQSYTGLPEDWSMINQLDIEEEDDHEDEKDDGSKSKKRKMMSQNEVHILAFAIIMLNSDLHTPNNKNRMTCEQFIKNYKGAFEAGCDVSDEYLSQIYERIRLNELKTGPDHVSQVMKVQQQLVPGNTKQTSHVPKLAIPSRRLVCFCRLYEVYDINKKDRAGQHQREVFLFNDILLVTKIYKKDSSTSSIMSGNNMIPTSTGLAGGHSSAPRHNQHATCQYSFRGSYSLSNVAVQLFEAPFYHFGIRMVKRVPGESKANVKTLITFNARNEHDRSRFVDDLREAIEEMALMDSIKINGFATDLVFGGKSSTSSLTSSVTMGNSNHKTGSAMSLSSTFCELRSSGSSTKSTGSLISSGSNGSNESSSSGTMKPTKSIGNGVRVNNHSGQQNMSKSSSMLDFGVNHVKSNSSTSTTSSNASSGLGSDKL